MATYPSGIAVLSNPTSSDKMNLVPHATQHIKANDEIEAIETALGVNLANVVQASALDTDGTLAANSDTKVATQKAVKTYADNIVISGGGIPFSYLDTDGTLAANSDTKIASQKAVKTFALPLGYLDTDDTLAADSDTKVPSQKAIKAYVDNSSAGATRGTFDNDDLSSGVLTITHNLALSAPYSVVIKFFDNNAKEVYPDVTGLTNTLTADFSNMDPITGTWGYAYLAG